MPFPDACQWQLCPTQAPRTSVKLSSSLWVCHLLYFHSSLSFPPCFCLQSISSAPACFCCVASTSGAQQKLNKSRWIADGQCSETKQRCSTFTLVLFNCLFNSVEVNGSVCYTAPLHWFPHQVWSWMNTIDLLSNKGNILSSPTNLVLGQREIDPSSRLLGQTGGCMKKKTWN